MNKNKAAQQLGKSGGQATAKKHGKAHFSAAGKKGMAKRWAKKKQAVLIKNPLNMLYK